MAFGQHPSLPHCSLLDQQRPFSQQELLCLWAQDSSDMTAPWLRQCFHSLSRRCSVSVQGSRSCSAAWGCCPSLQLSALAAAAAALGLAAEQKPLEWPMWRIPSPSTFPSGPRGSAGAVQAGWWHRSHALEKVAPAGTAPGMCGGGGFAVQVLQCPWQCEDQALLESW